MRFIFRNTRFKIISEVMKIHKYTYFKKLLKIAENSGILVKLPKKTVKNVQMKLNIKLNMHTDKIEENRNERKYSIDLNLRIQSLIIHRDLFQ